MVKSEKTICHISTVHPPFDDRIFYKECITLSHSDYKVILIVPHSVDEKIHNVNIVALPRPKSRSHRFIVSSFLAFKKTLAQKPDVVHIHDPELLWVGVLFRLLGKKTIYDVHEDVAKQILYKNWIGMVWVRVIVSKSMALIEKFASLFYNRIVVVTDDIKSNFSSSKTVLLRNFPRLDLIHAAKPIDIIKTSPVIIYLGSLTKERGIADVINAMTLINAELWLLGPWDSPAFEEYCHNSAGWQKTRYFGVKKLEEVYDYLKCADVAVAMLYKSKNFVTGLPVKAFEYMAMGVPMVLSDFHYWMEIFKECALFANPGNPADIAEKINYILNNRTDCERLTVNAAQLIESSYSWESESKKLVNLYKELLN